AGRAGPVGIAERARPVGIAGGPVGVGRARVHRPSLACNVGGVGEAVCRACGAPHGVGARYCAACGAALERDAVPVLDLDTDGPASRADEPPPDRSIGTAVMVVLALVAVVIVLSLVAGGSDDGDPAAASTTTTTTRPSPSRPGPPSRPRVPGSADEPGPVLAEDVRLDPVLGMAIVSVRGPGATVTVADLATG